MTHRRAASATALRADATDSSPPNDVPEAGVSGAPAVAALAAPVALDPLSAGVVAPEARPDRLGTAVTSPAASLAKEPLGAFDALELPEVLTVDELATLLRVERKSIYAAVQRGEIPGAVRVGRLLRFSRDAVLRWVRDGQRPPHARSVR